MTKKVFIQTYGCQMNVYDSVRMSDVLAPHGYEETNRREDADLVILNTCHIREKAAEKVYSELGRVRADRAAREEQGKKMLIAVGGCVAQAEGEEIMRRAPYVDIVMGSQSYHHLPRLVFEAEKKKGAVELDFPEVQKFDLLPESTRAQGPSAYVAVQEGCDKFCTFCVVPYTRGAEYSRPAQAIEREVRDLVENKGAVEIILLGQNVNAYHGEGISSNDSTVTLAGLIRKLARIEGLQRIRYTTSHPRDMSDDLIAVHTQEEKLMPFLHLPIQSGSDRILKAMNRRHTAADYIAIIEKMRKARPDIAISGDFIVGFPGETEKDFEETIKLVETVGYASAYSFKYSPRPGTPAAEREDQAPEEVKAERLARLQALLSRQQLTFNQTMVGKTLSVLLDREGKRPGQLLGRSPYMQSVHVDNAQNMKGQILEVRILSASSQSLKGSIACGDSLSVAFPPARTRLTG